MYGLKDPEVSSCKSTPAIQTVLTYVATTNAASCPFLGSNKISAKIIRDLSVSKAVFLPHYEQNCQTSFYDTCLLVAKHNPRNGE
jgi:hypothetical protein